MGIASRLLAFLVVIAVLFGSPAARAVEEVDLLLVLSSDVSRSVDAPKFKLQRDGYAAAIVNPRVVQAIRSGALGKIAISFVEWSGVGAQKIVIDWTVVRDEATARDFSAQVIEAPRAFADRTSISGGIDFAMAQLARAPFQSNRHTIDVSGDGTNNSGRDVVDARDEALAKGVTINGLVILSERPMSWNADHTNPPGGLDAYYRNNVIGGPGSFVMVAENFSSFGRGHPRLPCRRFSEQDVDGRDKPGHDSGGVVPYGGDAHAPPGLKLPIQQESVEIVGGRGT
jgi:hypothetical protein